MTIATCLVLPEGLVFGVDSTTSTALEIGYHYLNHNQKLFEVGSDSTMGIMTWGLSFFRDTSYRTLIARLSDDLKSNPPLTILDAVARWRDLVWVEYREAFKNELRELKDILERNRKSAIAVSDKRSEKDDDRFKELNELRVGFCFGGYCLPDRTPQAFYFDIEPNLISPPQIYPVVGELFKGQPAYFQRLYDGYDIKTRDAIVKAKDANGVSLWQGTKQDLNNILAEESLFYPELTIRDGIDFVHFSIYSTIKALKFSNRGQFCGGPIELAVITTDRLFRWVRHKEFDSALGYDGP